MSFGNYENSRKLGQPVELYLFRYGTDPEAFFAFTDHEEPIEHDEITYVPAPISREAVKTKGRLDKEEVKITVARTNQMATLLSFYPPSTVISLIIRQTHVPNPDAPAGYNDGEMFPVAWTGRIVERGGGPKASVELVGIPAGRSMSRMGLRRNYQWACPHALYGAQCGANKAARTTTEVVVSATGNQIVLAQPWGLAGVDPVKYIGGLVQWPGQFSVEYRMILRVTAPATLVVSGPVLNLTAADEVEVSAGCGRTLDDCENLHENILNYGGQPWIPTNNPFYKNNHD